jgi:hypothetical protein
MPGLLDLSQKKPYLPSAEESKFLLDVYTDFLYDRRLKTQPQSILDSRTLKQFWDESATDYNVLVGPEDINDPVKPYASSISRDKADAFITRLSTQLLYPSVVAMNSASEIDNTMSQVSRSMLSWAHENDGRPAESGHQKNSRYIHRMTVAGTVHIQDDIIDGRLQSTEVPNEEIYIPNFYEHNIQNQSRLMRVQNVINYEQAEQQFGELPNFRDYVIPMTGTTTRLMEESKFRSVFEAINPINSTFILRAWYPVPYKKVKEYITKGKLPKGTKKAKYFNIIINGVLMFPVDNLMPYHDGFYPINKGVFGMFSDPNYYWGNSMPNKARHDKKWLDGWKTLIRYKAKLSAIPPLITFNGQFVDSDIVVPGMISQAPAGMSKDDVQGIPGISTGVTTADINMAQDAERDIDRSTASPQTAGQQGSDRQTAREALIIESNNQKILMGFGMQIAYLVEARTFPILKRLYQFVPRYNIEKIAVPNQNLPSGANGVMDILFSQPQAMTQEELDNAELGLWKQERQSARLGVNKKITIVNIEYLNELDLYIKAVADNLVKETGALRDAKAEQHFGTYSARPDLFNVKTAARKLVQEYGDNEDEMLIGMANQAPDQLSMQPTPEEMAMQEATKGMGSGSGQNPISKMVQQGAKPTPEQNPNKVATF